MRRKNIQTISITTLGVAILLAAGCKSGGFTMPEMPKMAFWKKDGLQWSKKDTVPPPATHFDPEPSMRGFSGDEAVAEDKPESPERFATNEPFQFTPRDNRSSQDADEQNQDSDSEGKSSKPLRTPYKYIESEDLSGVSGGAFQPGGQLKTKLPDFDSSSKGFSSQGFDSGTQSGNETNRGSSAFTPPATRSAGENDTKSFSPGFSAPPTSSKQSEAMNDFAKKIEKELPGLPGQFKQSESGSSFKPGSTGKPSFPSFGAAGKATDIQKSSNPGFDTGKIRTPRRMELPPSNTLEKILTPQRQDTKGFQPGSGSLQPSNNLRSTEQSNTNSGYPSTKFQGFPGNNQGLSPLRPATKSGITNQTLQPSSPNPKSSSNRPIDSFSKSKSFGASSGSTFGQSNASPSNSTGPDVLLPASLRSADMSFAPGSVYKLMPSNPGKNESDKLIR